jgi:NAD(P)-dependent dehydrogenase (short-subunit alcohol dehydrogenase family)
MDLSSRVALVTGTRRIGAVVAETLAARGADVAVVYNRSKAEADAAAAKIRSLGRKALVVQADLSQPPECDRLVQQVDRELGRLDVLVNMASLYPSVPFDDLRVEHWDQQMAVDLRASFLCAKAAVPIMRRLGGGRIINFADWLPASERPRYKGYLTYYVAKAGVKGLTEALALELASDNILVNAIAPGPVLAPPETTDEELKSVEKNTPLGRWGGAEAIAAAVIALIGLDFVTGETLRVDGGRHVY